MPVSRRPQHAIPPQPIGHALRTLARWAVAASLSASGACAAQHEHPALGQTVPPPPPAAASGSPALAPDAGPQLAVWQGVAYGGWVVRSEWETCGPLSRDSVTLDAQGNVLAKSHEDLGHSGCVVGRRPVGLRKAQPKAMPSALGAYLAGNARLEAASVFAFERLAAELRELGAPTSLMLAARDAAQDERCHAQLVAQLARSYGAEPTEPRVDDAPQRSTFAIALENAVEGCVRESFGAVLAHYQAALAADPAIAQAMLRIAEDETRHAELAWQVAAWLEPQLSNEQRAELRAAQAVALDELAAELALEGMSAAERAALGWPSSALRARLLESMAAQLGMQAVS